MSEALEAYFEENSSGRFSPFLRGSRRIVHNPPKAGTQMEGRKNLPSEKFSLDEKMIPLALMVCDIDLICLTVLQKTRVMLQNGSWSDKPTSAVEKIELDSLKSSFLDDEEANVQNMVIENLQERNRHTLAEDNTYLAMGQFTTFTIRAFTAIKTVTGRAREKLRPTIVKLLEKGPPFLELLVVATTSPQMSRIPFEPLETRIALFSALIRCIEWLDIDDTQGEKWILLKAKIEARRKVAAYPQGPSAKPHDWSPTLTALTVIINTVAIIFIYFGWSYSEPEVGKLRDADFWWLLQNTLNQILALITLAVPIYQGSKLPFQSWFWTWCFILLASVATVLAPVLYLLLPVAYSGILSFVGSACQAFVVLQLSIAAKIAMVKEIEKEKVG